MSPTRRAFIKSGLAIVGLCLSAGDIFKIGALASETGGRPPGKFRVLVVVQLIGGNDGLNTVVPYGNPLYYKLRPTLAIPKEKVLPLTDSLGMHPNMAGLEELYQRGKLAIVQAVGYPNPIRSHFRSMEIWQTANPERILDTGWLGRYLDLLDGNRLLPAVNVDATFPMSLASTKVVVPSVSDAHTIRFRADRHNQEYRRAQIDAFTDSYRKCNLPRAYANLMQEVGMDANKTSNLWQQVVRGYRGSVAYPDNGFAGRLRFIAQMITSGVNASVYHLSLDGFDTHTNQTRTHGNLLRQLSDGLSSFQADLESHGADEDVVVLVFSEFGRRLVENGASGTDHGAAGPVFVLGSRVKGGFYGEPSSLTNLDAGDLEFKIDFRQVYATILRSWLGADSTQILAGSWDNIGFLS